MRAFAFVSCCLLATAPLNATTLEGAGEKALQHLLDRGRETHSAAVLVWQDGRELGHYYVDDKAPVPIELMSVTKSVVALGIGQLLDQGKIKSLDQPVADFYPEWRQGRKKDITLRMLMNHTSGLQNFPRTDVEIAPAPDAIQLALTAELTGAPGTTGTVYNNKAVNLLAGVIEKASGESMDLFFRDGLFKAMKIHPGPWEKDKAGHPYAMSGLPLTAGDLAKLGQLVLDRGTWQGERLLSATYIDTMLGPSSDQAVGLLWWQTVQWRQFDADPAAAEVLRKRGVPEHTVARLEQGLRGTHFDSESAMFAGLTKVLGPQMRSILDEQLISRGIGPYRLFKVTRGPVAAYYGEGDGGQYVVIVPSANIVAVRQIDADSDQEKEGENYPDLIEGVIELARVEGRLPPGPQGRPN